MKGGGCFELGYLFIDFVMCVAGVGFFSRGEISTSRQIVEFTLLVVWLVHTSITLAVIFFTENLKLFKKIWDLGFFPIKVLPSIGYILFVGVFESLILKIVFFFYIFGVTWLIDKGASSRSNEGLPTDNSDNPT